jgi:hypothetical protein
MTSKTELLMLALATLVALPCWAAPPSANRGQCSDIPLRLIVAPQTPGQGGISGDGLSIYNNPNDSAFNGGTQYQDGVGGVYVKFQLCNGTNDFIVNLRGTSPVRYLNLDFSSQLAPPDTADGAVDLTGQQYHQQGEQINEMADAALYNTSGQFVTCSGLMLNALSKTVTGGDAWFHPTTVYAPIVPGCNGGTPQDLANQPINTSPVLVQQVNSCTWTATPVPDSAGASRVGIAESVKKLGTTTSVAGGQYQMPFSYEIQKLNCTP